MSWEDAAGFVICLGGLNPLCWAGCSSPSETGDEDDLLPPPDSFIDNGNADHYVPPDTDTHILPDTPDTHDAANDSDSDAEDSTELPILPDVVHQDLEDEDLVLNPETTDSADLADTKDTLQETDSSADTPQDLADILGDTTDSTDSVEETDAPEIICVPEKCDGDDNDCDGLVDEDFVGLGNECEIGEGLCYSVGYYVCSDDGTKAICNAEVIEPQIEICGDKLDNDCDAATDEVCACFEATYQPIPTECGIGACYSEGATSCENGKVKDSCEPGDPLGDIDDTCDNTDDDCDGIIDDDYQSIKNNCGIGECFAKGAWVCYEGGDLQDTCKPKEPTEELCDGLDNDCNDSVDEEFGLGLACTVGVGKCENSGVVICDNDGETKCSVDPKAPALNDLTCDNKDNDCNGQVDDGYPKPAISCGVGACESTGKKECENGVEVDHCTPGTPTPELCDGINNDCDESTDEGCACIPATYKPVPTTCGVGACASDGETSCDAGAIKDACTPKAQAPNDTTCDDKDNDCNGETDEDYIPTPTSCGVGACIADGLLTCVGGKTVDTCEPGAPAPELCDGIDNNCAGGVDENLPDNDSDGICNEIDCDINDPDLKYLVLSCPTLTTGECIDALTSPALKQGDKVNIFIDYFSTNTPFIEGSGIQLCYDPFSYFDTPAPASIACLDEITYEITFGTKYIWDSADYTESLFFDKSPPTFKGGIEVLYKDYSILYNALSCQWL